MIDLALISLRPGAEWTLNGDTYEGLVWLDTVQKKPTVEEINKEIERLIEEFEKKQYQRDRADSYPAIKEQLDMIDLAVAQKEKQGFPEATAVIEHIKGLK